MHPTTDISKADNITSPELSALTKRAFVLFARVVRRSGEHGL
jgi:hypothetical protein